MAAKAVNARQRLDRNNRFRGHGPLLQGRDQRRDSVRIHRGMHKGPSPCR